VPEDAYWIVMRRRIRKARNARGMTQEEAAELADMALRHYQRFEIESALIGERDFNPKIKTLKAICEAIKLPLTKLVIEPSADEIQELKRLRSKS
jgi:transcriptional regulator with XRE-family HTH domain